jgi:hypothetical protein
MVSRHKKRRLVVYAAPASNSNPPAAPVKPAPDAKPAEGMLDFVIKLAAVGVFVVGVVTLASPWLRGADRQQHPLAAAGVGVLARRQGYSGGHPAGPHLRAGRRVENPTPSWSWVERPSRADLEVLSRRL